MARRIDADYSQQFLLPPDLEDWVGANHPARFIREFVEALDLEALAIVWASGEGGRPAYAAELLLKIWLYGYYERIRSSRKLEKACRDHIGFLWLAGMHVPDHNTLSTFFRANRKGIRKLFRKTVEVAIEAELVGFVLQAVDGTKIAARVANRGGWHKKGLLERLDSLDQELADLERQIEANDNAGAASDGLPETLQTRQALRAQVREALQRLEQAGQEHLHPADEDARVMPCKERHANVFAYNGQAVADDKAGIVVACEVTQDCNDEQQLNAMIDQVREQAGQEAQRTVADTGYATGPELAVAEHKQRDVIVALPQKMRPDPQKTYAASNFTYDKEHDICRCPHGGELAFSGARYRQDRDYELRRYQCTVSDCPHRAQCTKSKTGRTVDLNQYYEVIERQRKKHQDPKARSDLRKRGYLIEPVFAFIKQHLEFRRFTLCGLEQIRAQWSLLCATYNLHKLFKHWRNGSIRFSSGPQKQKAASTQGPLRPTDTLTPFYDVLESFPGHARGRVYLRKKRLTA
jgi:transposase